jgi:hypothetical protein
MFTNIMIKQTNVRRFLALLSMLSGLAAFVVGQVTAFADAGGVPTADPTYGWPVPHLSPSAKSLPAAHWIWLGPVVGDQQLLARTTVTLAAVPRAATLWITGDDAFSVSINGHSVDQSHPVEQGWEHPHQDTVAKYLHAGKNVIAVTGVNKGGGAAGLLVEMDVNGVSVVASGSSWKAHLTTNPPAGWAEPGFHDAAWANATDEGAVGMGVWGGGVAGWPSLTADAWYMAHVTRWPIAAETLSGTALGLPRLLQRAPAAGVSIARPTQILLDFGRELSGRLQFAGSAGATIQVHTGESRAACLRVMNDARLLAIDNSGPWTVTLQGADVQSTPYTAFRFALLTLPAGRPITLTRATCDFKYYPVSYRGAFSCSDPLLTKIWYTGAYTAHLCMQEDIWDAPKRDRGLWIGDMHVSGETINTVFADRFLVERTIAGGRAQAQNGRPDTQLPTQDVNSIPGYTASWFGVLADFYRHSGDIDFLRSQHAAILSLLAYQRTEFDKRHLFTNPYNAWDFCDWAPDFVRGTPQTLATTDLFDIYGVRQAVFLLKALGDEANAAEYASWAETLTAAARAGLADPRTQDYGDRVQENAMAVYADVATAAQRPAIYDSVLKPGSPAWNVPSAGDLAGSEVMSPFYGYYVLRAYGKLGEEQAGIDLLRRYWGAMLVRGTTTWWECFDPTFPQDMNVVIAKMPYVSLCHGWSSGPTPFLTECILGVQPLSGGYGSVLIRPELCDLKWVSGTVPTPHGPIIVRAARAGKGTVCTVTLPPGIHASVVLPGKTTTLSRAGTYTVKD